MSKPYVLGIDIGGTNTVFGIVDARGHVLASSSIKTAKHHNFDDYIAELHAEIMKLLEANEAVDKIQGIGIGAPNANYYTGEIVDAPNLPWSGTLSIASKVSAAFKGIPVAVTNDANAAALGEMTYGAARGMRDFIMMVLPASWDTSSASPTTAASAVAVAQAAWRLTALPPAWLAQLASSWKHALTPLRSVSSK